MKLIAYGSKPVLTLVVTLALGGAVHAQINSGSDGSDGALNITNDTTINMADHPNGIFQYTSVDIENAMVSFVPNANNTPVVWLVQSNCTINGFVTVNGQDTGSSPGIGGPGGFRGGNSGTAPTPGFGPGGGLAGYYGGNGSYGSSGATNGGTPGPVYGNIFLVPLLGGSGGGGGNGSAGAGGGGAILIAASGTLTLNGSITALGGNGQFGDYGRVGSGSGGAVRLAATKLVGSGSMWVTGGSDGGDGRIRIDTQDNTFGGHFYGQYTIGYQPIIIPTATEGAQIKISSISGVPISATPSGSLVIPDAVLSAAQNNPIPITVSCVNVPLNTQITVVVKPYSGAAISATALNSSGTAASSTATVSVIIPRGGGTVYATATTN